MKILIVGLGGIGSALISPLGKFFEFYSKEKPSLVLIDGDKVEKNNLARQNFIETDISRNKADAMRDYMNDLFKGEIISISQYLKPENINLITDDSVVFVCVDNYITRTLIEEHSLKLKNILVIFGGNEYDDGDVNVLYIKNGKLLTPKYSEKHPEVLKKDKFPDEVSCAEGAKSFPQLIFVNTMVAQVMINTYYSFLQLGKVSHNEVFVNIKHNAVRAI